MRIGTWNMAGRWGSAHLELVLGMDCDVLLLTEVSERVDMPGYVAHLGRAEMAAKRRWAGIFSRSSLEPLPDPHPASVLGIVDGVAFCCSVLPWRSCGSGDTWGDGNHAAKTERCVATLGAALPRSGLVWGGDFNHALDGAEHAGSKGGRRAVVGALDTWGLTAPTTSLPHQIDTILSIDHVAVPTGWTATSVEHISALTPTGRLSDHDAYVVQAQP